MQLTFQHGDDLITLDVHPDGDGWRVRLPNGEEHRITAERLPGDVLVITDGDRTFRVPFARSDRGWEFSHAGNAYAFTPTAPGRKPAAKRSAGTLASPMGGVVADILVEAGQTVEAYAPLVVIEAMKVYATIEAPFAGVVTSVYVRKGDRVELGQQVVDIGGSIHDTAQQNS